MVSIQSIDIKDPFYPLEQELRNKILLRPIGIPDHAWEMHDEKSWHFVAVENDNVMGCVVLVPLNPEQTKTQLMQMAVETEQQGKGIGKLLVKELLAFSKSKGIIWACPSRLLRPSSSQLWVRLFVPAFIVLPFGIKQ